jgi:hypothetical protein
MKLIAWLTLMFIGFMVGCSTAPLQSPLPQESWKRPLLTSDVESLLMYYEWAHRLSIDQVTREYDSVRQTYARSPSDFDRLRFSILLAMPGTSISDLPHAIELLDSVAKNPDAPFYLVAFLLQSQFNDQRRLGVTVNELRQKLDALKSLEKDMSEHGVGTK